MADLIILGDRRLLEKKSAGLDESVNGGDIFNQLFVDGTVAATVQKDEDGWASRVTKIEPGRVVRVHSSRRGFLGSFLADILE